MVIDEILTLRQLTFLSARAIIYLKSFNYFILRAPHSGASGHYGNPFLFHYSLIEDDDLLISTILSLKLFSFFPNFVC